MESVSTPFGLHLCFQGRLSLFSRCSISGSDYDSAVAIHVGIRSPAMVLGVQARRLEKVTADHGVQVCQYIKDILVGGNDEINVGNT